MRRKKSKKNKEKEIKKYKENSKSIMVRYLIQLPHHEKLFWKKYVSNEPLISNFSPTFPPLSPSPILLFCLPPPPPSPGRGAAA
jgi:hypothetical protein